MANHLEAAVESASRRPVTARTLWINARIGLLFNRWPLFALLLVTPLIAYFISLSTPDVPAEGWIWLEVIFIPIGVILSADAFIGRYERGEMEMLLARRSARRLFLHLLLPNVLTLVAASAALSLTMSAGGPLEAAARALLVLGVTHLLMSLTKSRWFGLVFFSLWWLVGLTDLANWATSRPAVAMWHPMRLSGGGVIDSRLEGTVLLIGISLLAASWLAVGRDDRWLT
jgi:hypothetical protein